MIQLSDRALSHASRATVRAETATARPEEGLGAGDQRGAGRDDVVDEHDPATGDGRARRESTANAAATLAARRAAQLVLGPSRARAGARGAPGGRAPRRPPARAAPPGRSRARRAGRGGPARGRAMSPPIDASAPARGGRRAERPGQALLAAVLEGVEGVADEPADTGRTTPAGRAGAARRTASRAGRPPARLRRAASARPHGPQSAAPSRPHPTQTAGNARSRSRPATAPGRGTPSLYDAHDAEG